jgi:hypothetical protein
MYRRAYQNIDMKHMIPCQWLLGRNLIERDLHFTIDLSPRLASRFSEARFGETPKPAPVRLPQITVCGASIIVRYSRVWI